MSFNLNENFQNKNDYNVYLYKTKIFNFFTLGLNCATVEFVKITSKDPCPTQFMARICQLKKQSNFVLT